MTDSPLAATLRRHEGFRRHAYTDTEGYLTIGYGTNIHHGLRSAQIEAILKAGITDDQASALMDLEIVEIQRNLARYRWYLKLSDDRKNVIINMTYNLGLQGILKFKKMIDAIVRDDYKKAAEEMLDSKWRDQVGQRARELASVMKSGKWYHFA